MWVFTHFEIYFKSEFVQWKKILLCFMYFFSSNLDKFFKICLATQGVWWFLWNQRACLINEGHRVSKSCNHVITRLRKIFENVLKIWTSERETGKSGPNFMYSSKIFKTCFVSYIYMSILMHVSALKKLSEQFDYAKELLVVEDIKLSMIF